MSATTINSLSIILLDVIVIIQGIRINNLKKRINK